MDGGIDLIAGEAAATHQHAVPTEDRADRPPFDAELIAQLVYRHPGPVTGDEFLRLVGVERACPPQFRPVDGGDFVCASTVEPRRSASSRS